MNVKGCKKALLWPNLSAGYARMNVIVSRTSFVIASVRSSIH